ncbi:anhydro-N-acetylmuramic acid kinase [Alteromonas hispanica]|uniref:Anhydro-N-acetylmuramic acid kinase n=1 Tax=Alteromonas hispanica TaxID=315421 RepID=A0A6L9MWW9_9ALTE|nr:anhydro-N-acetylmuramic acid kinase [Alteromonas hispanica]NDW22587.1 anhydro-N-acetylmuramic acid kinase [Alteromonas hispanica]
MAKYIGLMSGTSMDGVDAVLCDITRDSCNTLAAYSLPYPKELLVALNALCVEGANELNTLAVADRLVAEVFADAVNSLLKQENLSPFDITAIGSHGQTVRHHPNCDVLSVSFGKDNIRGFTCQIGDANTLAVLTDIDVVADFRKKDIALGGQGAPLVPAYHNAVFSHPSKYRVLVNIGGIANITVLSPSKLQHSPMGFDTGPGNTLMDNWIRLHLNKTYDSNGEWASTGTVNEELLTHMLKDKYFALPFPKSTGREYFNIDWLSNYLSSSFAAHPGKEDASSENENSKENGLQPCDIQATLLALTAHTISDGIQHAIKETLSKNGNAVAEGIEVIACGGGAFNRELMDHLTIALPNYKVLTSHTLGIHPQHVEGAAFAWLAFANLNNIKGNVPQVTGASRAAVLGALYKKE